MKHHVINTLQRIAAVAALPALAVTMLACADNDMPQPVVQTVDLESNVLYYDEYLNKYNDPQGAVRMTFRRRSNNVILNELTTGTDGRYAIDGFIKTQYVVEADADGFGITSEQGEVPAGATGSWYAPPIKIRQASTTVVTLDPITPGATDLTWTFTGTIDPPAEDGASRGVRLLFGNGSVDRDDPEYSVVTMYDNGGSFSVTVDALTLLANGITAGKVNVEAVGASGVKLGPNQYNLAGDNATVSKGIFTLER
jgi:hypothetical protein